MATVFFFRSKNAFHPNGIWCIIILFESIFRAVSSRFEVWGSGIREFFVYEEVNS